MAHDIELAYLGVEVPSPATLAPFFGGVIGLEPGEELAGGRLTWRNDERAHRIIVQPGGANDAAFVGFEATDPTAFAAVVDRLRSTGLAVEEGTDELGRARRVQRLAHCLAPWGVTVEVVLGLEAASTPLSSPLVPGGFLTSGLGFGHVVFATTAFDESHEFLVHGLGMRQSDWLQTEIGPGVDLEVRFYHCNQRHHSVALARAPFELPQKLHHIMFETNQRDDVGAAFDRVWASDLDIANGLGRHGSTSATPHWAVSRRRRLRPWS